MFMSNCESFIWNALIFTYFHCFKDDFAEAHSEGEKMTFFF